MMNTKFKNILFFILIIIIFIGYIAMKENKISSKDNTEIATFAGGCFWCMEPPFENLNGVDGVVLGYTGGKTENPTYQEVSMGNTGHYEAVQISYNPNIISYEKLLEVFWQQIDPNDKYGQFVDKGSQYRTAIFYHNEKQKNLAERSKNNMENSGRFDKPIVTEILAYTKFYPAEDYHQNFFKTSIDRYKNYRRGSGRDQYLAKIWKNNKKESKEYQKPGNQELKKTLYMHFSVGKCQEEGFLSTWVLSSRMWGPSTPCGMRPKQESLCMKERSPFPETESRIPGILSYV